jgi:hypothetical protein
MVGTGVDGTVVVGSGAVVVGPGPGVEGLAGVVPAPDGGIFGIREFELIANSSCCFSSSNDE